MAAEPGEAKSKAQKKRERQRQKQKGQAARDEVSRLLDQLGLTEYLWTLVEHEMDIGASATLGHPSVGAHVCVNLVAAM